ncbi:MAG: response regulator [Bacteroidales bacterium]|nr:response regulator [Bacteroidales bacterium]
MRYTILAADDSKMILRTIEEMFKMIANDEFKFIFANDGRTACKLAEEHLPDLILMDVLMPEMNGIQATINLKKNPRTSHIPIIVLSATESLQSAFEAGATDFITKPFKHYELLIRVKQALNLVAKISKINIQNEELELQKQVLIKQRDLISAQKKDILDDIEYSKRIQQAILPQASLIKLLIPSHFLINKPKNIVSGDFYWVGKREEDIIVVVADCTGHGISGAFMTMAGTAFLNEIINKYNFKTAAEILDLLRKKVMKLLNQKGEVGEAADGMDIALVLINLEKGNLQFAGANNPLFLIRDNELEIIKGDRMPIGIHRNYNQPFTNHILNLLPGDKYYLFTDGYPDQFGGPSNKKFRIHRFKELLLNNHMLPMSKQCKVIEDVFYDWKGDLEQIDDVLIMGFSLF